MALQKPERAKHTMRKRRVVASGIDNAVLAKAAEAARYVSSPYHRPKGSKMGAPTGRSYPHASKCDPKWLEETANRALKDAIRQGRVSAEWQNEFPRYAWHRDGNVLYEAALSNQVSGEYHAYPLSEEFEWPTGLVE